ncbi:hypothetical protein LAZ67_2002928 [Cordylochernes scorpioides]|uniref:Uncharacterized protein n=1 Tax=Cordylochernes scorpioides TaxID=51811 RepID=A0ABY6K2D6_9ARAC|nr:hypothetical protein LAZ67_2002928 [Cordylochernes scorpioides]
MRKRLTELQTSTTFLKSEGQSGTLDILEWPNVRDIPSRRPAATRVAKACRPNGHSGQTNQVSRPQITSNNGGVVWHVLLYFQYNFGCRVYLKKNNNFIAYNISETLYFTKRRRPEEANNCYFYLKYIIQTMVITVDGYIIDI